MFQSSIAFDNESSFGVGNLPVKFVGSALTDKQLMSVINGQERYVFRGLKVRVYRNLNKPEYFSIMPIEGEFKGKVCAYAKSVLVMEPRFVVSEKSRQRVLRDKCRNVHAFVEGRLDDLSMILQTLSSGHTQVTYNPYRCGSFYARETGIPVLCAGFFAVVQGADVYVS